MSGELRFIAMPNVKSDREMVTALDIIRNHLKKNLPFKMNLTPYLCFRRSGRKIYIGKYIVAEEVKCCSS